MKAGDLVMLRECIYQGKTGIILSAHEPARFDLGTELYYVFSEAVVRCFTGNQLELA